MHFLRFLIPILLLFFSMNLHGQVNSKLENARDIEYKWETLGTATLLDPEVHTTRVFEKKIAKQPSYKPLKSKKVFLETEIHQKSAFPKPRIDSIFFSSKELTNLQEIEVPFFQYKDHSLINVKYSDKSHGFFSNTIYAIDQDQTGFMWVASGDDGLCKYNGTNMEIITTENGLPSNVVTHIFNDSQNRLWVGTEAGICYIKN